MLKNEHTAEFDEAMSLRDRGELNAALDRLEMLARKLTSEERTLLTHTYLQLGNIAGKIGDNDRATQHFMNAVELSPNHELSSLALFHKLCDSGQWKRALQELLRYVSIRDSQDYREILANGFKDDVAPELAALAEKAREIMRRYSSE